MALCKIINFFYACAPLKILRDMLIRRHGERCSLCQDRLASQEEAVSLLVQEAAVSPARPAWPEIKLRLAGEVLRREADTGRIAVKEKDELGLGTGLWRWVIGAAAFLLVGLASFWLWRGFTPGSGLPPQDQAKRFRINYLRVENKPGQAYLYQPGESDLIIIWVQKPT